MRIKQNWKIQVLNKNPLFPAIVFDNWYTPNEEKAVWKELDFYSATPRNKILRAENTVVATNPKTNQPLSRAFRFYHNQFYTTEAVDSGISPIFNCCYKQRTKEFHQIVSDNAMPYARSFTCSNSDTHLISYYENDDHYDEHFDTFAWTMCIWFVKEPRKFDGGDFIFPETKTEIKLKHNRAVFFPSCLLHKVTPVKFKEPVDEIGFGRYTITHWYYSVPKGKGL